MNINKKVILFFSLFIFLPAIIYAETYWGGELPNISDTKLKVKVMLADGIYSYMYTITSGNTNTGQIWSFDIDVRKPENSIEVSGEGLVNGPGYLEHTSAQILSETTTPKMIPVGLFSPPNWNSGPDILGRVGWGSNDVQYRILPGQSLGSFKITSRGIPILRDFIIEPKLIPPSEESDITIEQIQEIEDKVAFKGKTLGPTAPPADFKPIDFHNYIISLKHEAYKLGWIIQGKDDDKGKKEDEEKGIMKSLDEKLDKAKKKLEKGDTKEAVEKLKSFIHEVEGLYKEDKDKEKEDHRHEHITSEAYALLKYNAQYLIEQLGGEKEGKKDKKE
ncbi:MAG: hypothetical protein HY096_15420 [Nitrospinae bacterium]|nr:hypothetical protein [Nitrospinota bacterium]